VLENSEWFLNIGNRNKQRPKDLPIIKPYKLPNLPKKKNQMKEKEKVKKNLPNLNDAEGKLKVSNSDKNGIT